MCTRVCVHVCVCVCAEKRNKENVSAITSDKMRSCENPDFFLNHGFVELYEEVSRSTPRKSTGCVTPGAWSAAVIVVSRVIVVVRVIVPW